MKPLPLLRMWLSDAVAEHRAREAKARRAYPPGTPMHETCRRFADCHAAAALIYETELAKLGKIEP